MFTMKRDEYREAVSKAMGVKRYISENYGINEGDFVPLDFIVQSVKRMADYVSIDISKMSFRDIKDKDNNAIKAGAMLSTSTRINPDTGRQEQIAQIIVNNDMSPQMQRFSVAHELGHLITENPSFEYETANDGKYTLSMHINSDITFIDEKECEKSRYLVAEQAANIFALLVLIWKNIKIRDVTVEGGMFDLAKRYGVTEDAILSRMLLSSAEEGETN